MTILSDTIRLRAPGEMVRAAEAWANAKGETISGMIRRLLSAEVPGLALASELPPLDEATLVADVLAGVTGASHRLLLRVNSGTAEQKDRLLRLLAGYLVWEYRAPPDAAAVSEIAVETDRLLAGMVEDERKVAA